MTEPSHLNIYPLHKNVIQLLDISKQQIKSNCFGLIYIYTQVGDKDDEESVDLQISWKG